MFIYAVNDILSKFRWWKFLQIFGVSRRGKYHIIEVLLLLLAEVVSRKEKLLPGLQDRKCGFLPDNLDVCSVVQVCICYILIVMIDRFMLFLFFRKLFLSHKWRRFLWYMGWLNVAAGRLFQMMVQPAFLVFFHFTEETLDEAWLTCLTSVWLEAIWKCRWLWSRREKTLLRCWRNKSEIRNKYGVHRLNCIDGWHWLAHQLLLFASLLNNSKSWLILRLHDLFLFFFLGNNSNFSIFFGDILPFFLFSLFLITCWYFLARDWISASHRSSRGCGDAWSTVISDKLWLIFHNGR